MDLSSSHNWLIRRLNRRKVVRFARFCRGELLDIGCGDKPYEDVIGPRVTRYVGLEHEGTVHARDKVDVWGDATELPFPDGEFETVVSFHVLEHTEEPAVVLREAFRVLRPGGHLLLAVPFVWGIHEAPRDFYRFTPFGLEHLVGGAGFEGVVVDPLCGYWATAGLRLSYALQRLARGPLAVPAALLLGAIQAVALVLDRLDFVDTDVAGYFVLARRPSTSTSRRAA